MGNVSYIPNRLKNAAEDGYVAGTEDIYDDTREKTQKQINEDVDNAITSLDTSITGNNVVVRTGATPSGTGEAGKIYRYVNPNGTTYADYMYSGDNWVALAQHTSGPQSQIAYYTCTQEGSGALETKAFVSTGGLTYTPIIGGEIKIKMGEANTHAAPVYLQFNTDATNTKKRLYYNGEDVSASNTWEAGETISVYYDGTYYQASNAMGGGNVGKKKLKGIPNVAISFADSIADDTVPVGTAQSSQTATCIEQKVNEGDVIMITAKGAEMQGLGVLLTQIDFFFLVRMQACSWMVK